MSLPSFDEFAAALRAQGFDEVLERHYGPDVVIGTHTHAFSVQALVVQGEVWLTCGEQTRKLGAGDSFELALEAPHAERYGTEGATYWVGRRNGR